MKRILKTLLLLLMPLGAFGQLTPFTNQYILNPLSINPAYAGNREVMNIAAFYRKQWVGIKGSPETMSFAADAPFNDDRMGLGLQVVNDKIGVTNETKINTDYSYKINMKRGILSFGLGAGIIMTNTAWSKLVHIDPEDNLNDTKIYVAPDFTFGAYYSSQSWFAGFSIPRLLGYKFDTEKNKYVIKNSIGEYSYMFNTGYMFDLSPKLKFFPSALVVYSESTKLLYDINAHFRIMDRFWIGASYRNSRAISGMFQFQVNNQLKLAYTYDFDFAKLRTFSSGSHEVMLRYEFRYKVEAVSPLNF
ncbi:MAG: type IX secretion system membrane protein PorP/SprF [Bacteroidota bacterium]|nr:type IX secretion system membrane protein PorP/SprF [Bacteroidota bacterium]